MLSHDEARAFYDRFGAKQDLQRVYEDPAIAKLLAHAGFRQASSVVELGCGTGRLAERILREWLPPDATYVGLDVSETMVGLARGRLRPWATRARVERTDGSVRLALPDERFDRFLSTYVIDLLPEEEIAVVLTEARRLLTRGGLLCLASLTYGETALSRAVSALWTRVHARRPALLGGCRPVRLQEIVGSEWRVLHRQVVSTLGLCSEVLIAARP